MPGFLRSVCLLFCGLILITISMAVLNTLVPLWLAHEDYLTWQVGMTASAYFVGNMLGTLLAGRTIRFLGFNRSYYLSCIIFSIATIGLFFIGGFSGWLVLRLIAGIACSMIWVIVESALLRIGTIKNRGQLLAAYMIIYYLGTVVGQLLVAHLPTTIHSVIPWSATLVLIAIIPLLFAFFAKPEATHNKNVSLLPMLTYSGAGLGIFGCVISGIILGSLYSILPLYLNHLKFADASVGNWMALMVCAGIIGQWPLGKIADRYGRFPVICFQLVMIMVGAALILMHLSMSLSLLLLGCAAFSLYPVAMAWACERVDKSQIVAMNQLLLLSYTIGSLIGPVAISTIMQHNHDNLFFVMLFLVAVIYLVSLFSTRVKALFIHS